jgi:hypothetical protein
MNTLKLTFTLVGLSTWLFASPQGFAAPKAPSKTKRQTKSAAVVKREYAFVVAGVPLAQGQGVMAYLPGGRQIFVPTRVDGYKAIAQMLNRLGEQGWEVAGYQDTTGAPAGGQSWTLTRRK